MPSFKSPSGKRFAARRETRDILATRRGKARHALDIKTSAWLGDEASGRGYESAGHYHWRLGHKNLAKPVLRTRRVKTVSTPCEG